MLRMAPVLFAVSTAFVTGTAHATLPAQSAMSPDIERELAAELETPEAKQVAAEALEELEKAADDAAKEAALVTPEDAAAADVEVAAVGDAAIVGNKRKKDDAGRGSRCRTMGGMASWYGPGFQGRKTASGERFNTAALTAAHRTLPFNTNVRVTNKKNGRAVIVRINDRGPFAHGRVIDLSRAAAKTIGIDGVGAVNLETCL